MIRTIVFAADLGIFTSHVLQHVVSLAKSYHAKVVVVHAVEPLGSLANAVVKAYLPESSDELFTQDNVEKFIVAIESRVKTVLEQEFLGEKSGLDCITSIRVVQGSPARVVLDESDLHHADLIVMGSHGPNAMDDSMLGSVTAKVLQLTKIPVYMIPMMKPANLDAKSKHHQMQLWQ